MAIKKPKRGRPFSILPLENHYKVRMHDAMLDYVQEQGGAEFIRKLIHDHQLNHRKRHQPSSSD